MSNETGIPVELGPVTITIGGAGHGTAKIADFAGHPELRDGRLKVKVHSFSTFQEAGGSGGNYDAEFHYVDRNGVKRGIARREAIESLVAVVGHDPETDFSGLVEGWAFTMAEADTGIYCTIFGTAADDVTVTGQAFVGG